MWLRLDLEGIDFRLRISRFRNKRSEDDDWRGMWCKVDLSLQAADWLHYRMEQQETMECWEVEKLRDTIQNLLEDHLDKPTVMECTEPDFEFRFYPKEKQEYGIHAQYVKQSCYEMTDLFMDFGLSFWDRKWGLMTTQLVMTFDRVDLEKLLCYLQFITGVISEQDSAVCRLIADGTMCEHDVQEKDGV